jgi:hypothetical protein
MITALKVPLVQRVKFRSGRKTALPENDLDHQGSAQAQYVIAVAETPQP